MPQEITLAGSLAETSPLILKARTEAREKNGWIMDVYLLKRKSAAGEQR
jgi:precorrin-6A synthase